MKRKVVIFGLIAAMVLSIGCGKDTNVVGSTNASADSKAASTSKLDEVSYKGNSISLSSKPADMVASVGEPDEKFENDNVVDASGKSNKLTIYKYENDGLIIQTQGEGDSEEIATIIINSENAVLGNGIKLGASEEAVKAAYGEPIDDGQHVYEGCGGVTYTYENENTTETFAFVDGKLSNVSIYNKKYECEC